MKVDLTGITGSTIDNINSTQHAPAEHAVVSNVETNSTEDAATVSVVSARVNSLVAQANNAPEIREDKVESLRQAIASGQYSVDPAQIAEAMIRESE
jgi:negative regulator of flagellin synthesis FlgM